MNDILPPRRHTPPRAPTPLVTERTVQVPPQSAAPMPSPTPEPGLPNKQPKKRLLWRLLVFGVAVLVLLGTASLLWYFKAIQPVSVNDSTKKRVQITIGSSPAEIAATLKKNNIIRSKFAFEIYTRVSGVQAKLQAGTYTLSPSESLSAIVDHLTSGKAEQFTLTFYPGATLTDTSATPESKKTDVQTILLRAGYSKSEVDAALNRSYTHPLFADKPASAGLEGYVYGETYNFDSNTTAEQILMRTFDEYYAQLQKNNLVESFKKQGLNLYQGITLASIIQREVPGASDQKQVAQVFLLRLAKNMPLGSDVTYQYAAKKMGVAPTPLLDSPYNTRKVAGFPPGPISTPGLSALKAVASPSPGNYLYFLSGDDGKTYFANTGAEHESNIKNYCQVKCSYN